MNSLNPVVTTPRGCQPQKQTWREIEQVGAGKGLHDFGLFTTELEARVVGRNETAALLQPELDVVEASLGARAEEVQPHDLSHRELVQWQFPQCGAWKITTYKTNILPEDLFEQDSFVKIRRVSVMLQGMGGVRGLQGGPVGYMHTDTHRG